MLTGNSASASAMQLTLAQGLMGQAAAQWPPAKVNVRQQSRPAAVCRPQHSPSSTQATSSCASGLTWALSAVVMVSGTRTQVPLAPPPFAAQGA
jgi:hypothetical protein